MTQQYTAVGNLTDDPTLRWTQSGLPVASFTIAVNTRVRQGDQWVDGDPSFVRCSVWRGQAENVAGSLGKGDRVIAVGTFAERKWQDKDGQNRSSWELTVDAVGPSLQFATAQPQKAQRGGGGQQQGGYQQPQQGYQQGGGGDPWGGQPQASQGYQQGPPPQNQSPWGGGPQQRPQQPQGQQSPNQGGPWGGPPQDERPPF